LNYVLFFRSSQICVCDEHLRRMGDGGRQFVVYSMTIDMAKPLAMVLPIPWRKVRTKKPSALLTWKITRIFSATLRRISET